MGISKTLLSSWEVLNLGKYKFLGSFFAEIRKIVFTFSFIYDRIKKLKWKFQIMMIALFYSAKPFIKFLII